MFIDCKLIFHICSINALSSTADTLGEFKFYIANFSVHSRAVSSCFSLLFFSKSAISGTDSCKSKKQGLDHVERTKQFECMLIPRGLSTLGFASNSRIADNTIGIKPISLGWKFRMENQNQNLSRYLKLHSTSLSILANKSHQFYLQRCSDKSLL